MCGRLAPNKRLKLAGVYRFCLSLLWKQSVVPLAGHGLSSYGLARASGFARSLSAIR